MEKKLSVKKILIVDDDPGILTLVKKILSSQDYDVSLAEDGLDALAKIGGLEIGCLAGIALAAAEARVPVVLDGFITTAAALTAWRINPVVKEYFIPSHRSVEPGHQAALQALGLEPLLDLALRLGEGTGAALAFGIIEASVKLLAEMATFGEAGVDQKQENEPAR